MRFRIACALLAASLGCSERSAAPLDTSGGQWPSFAGGPKSARHSPLAQIDATNFGSLETEWTWTSADVAWLRDEFPKLGFRGAPDIANFQLSPLVIDGVLYGSTSIGQVFALDAATGEERWLHDPRSYVDAQGKYRFNPSPKHRGVAYWRDGGDERIFMTTIDATLLALDARSGDPIASFGVAGRVDLRAGLRRSGIRPIRDYFQSSPPLVVGDVVVVGGTVQDRPIRQRDIPGDVRGYDARTGALRWTFHVIPEAGEPGVETWERGSFERAGAANVWGTMSADLATGRIYVPTSTVTNDFYGGHRLGDNLYSETLLCLDAATGERVWHQQLVRHGLWDYDLAAPPNLVEIDVDGQRIEAVAQVTKQGFTFVFDRRTGEPVWPIEDRAVAASDVPGERAAPTQRFPTRPPPFERQGTFERDLVDFTPAIRDEALAIFRRFRTGPLYTPPSREGTMILPGPAGGASWQGAAFDPESRRLFVPSITEPIVLALVDGRRKLTDFDWVREWTSLPKIGGAAARSDTGATLPLFAPPVSRITAIDLDAGDIAWQVANGDGARKHPALSHLDLPPLGAGARTCPLVTRTLLIAGDGGDARFARRGEPILRAFDKGTGRVVGTLRLPAKVMGCPITYQLEGRQYLVAPIGDPASRETGAPRLVALTLPDAAAEPASAAFEGRVRGLRPGEEVVAGGPLDRIGEGPVAGGGVPLGRWFPAEPREHGDAEIVRDLETLGYVAGSDSPTSSPVVSRHDPSRAQPGFNFYVSGHGRVALLRDMEGRVLHQWRMPPRKRAQDGAFNSLYFFRAHLFENGDVLGLLTGERLVKIDRDSRVIWEKEMRVHHDFEVTENGDIYVLVRKARRIPRIDPDRNVVEDFVLVLGPDGSEKRRVSLLEALEGSAYAGLLGGAGVRYGDLFHTNTLSVIDARPAGGASWMKPGNVITSFRVLDAVAVVDMATETVVRAWKGSFKKQHDPQLLANGNLLLFDNRGGGAASGVMEFDPGTDEMRWEYRGSADAPFFSETCGTAQRLENGNTLVTESDRGRVFEVTPGREIVWEFHSPHRAGESGEYVAAIFEMVRLSETFPIDWARGPGLPRPAR